MEVVPVRWTSWCFAKVCPRDRSWRHGVRGLRRMLGAMEDGLGTTSTSLGASVLSSVH